ncbi:hypothetical protein QEZ52_23130 (plasmid) [Aliisedimentitalea scapharcae]|jgi:DNA-binding transcriptional LysR family regulator|uniref:LysR substrate-binding domain-containing protein n=1 Tax=Aliisedimentitalea scapharcae TaxID=1524259 RepID=A0ABZ2XZU3_9RHOB|nr:MULTISPECIES: LysR substrate-binding domain-containing protein [Paracoccaceae]MDU8928381.1 hypothetical protein [Alisedimentitalea sp. MJ-SS2]
MLDSRDESPFGICATKPFRLLNLDGPAHASEDWANLFSLAGVENIGNLGGLWFTDYGNVISAAREGKGIAIGWRHVVDRYLRTGELVNPTGEIFRTGRGFYLLSQESHRLSEPAQIVHNWILETFGEQIGKPS